MIGRLGGAIEHDERVAQLQIPDRLPMRLEIHRRPGEACPRGRAAPNALASSPSGAYRP
jgi:hypothetical protein